VETGEAEEKDGISSTSSMSKDLFRAAGGKRKDTRCEENVRRTSHQSPDLHVRVSADSLCQRDT